MTILSKVHTFATASMGPNLHRMRELEAAFSVSSQLDIEGKEQSASNSFSLERGNCIRLRGMYLLQAKPSRKEKQNKKGKSTQVLKKKIIILASETTY